MAESLHRPTQLRIDLDALRHNVSVLRGLAPTSAICAVVKANGYGHGAIEIARGALEAGAAGLAVSNTDEGVELRDAGISAPVLVLSDAPSEAEDALVAASLTATVSSRRSVLRLAAAARRVSAQVPVHVCVDTGMHREGSSLGDALDVLEEVQAHQNLRLEGIWTHFAVADEGGEADSFTTAQIDRFDSLLNRLPTRPTVVHAANSAATLRFARAHYDMVRCGIALYGIDPAPPLASNQSLRPVLTLHSKVATVREVQAGERPSYGRRRALEADSRIATIPIGYADGVRRSLLDAGGYVLINGHRCALAGSVSMDQIVVVCPDAADIAEDDDVVLIGTQGDESIPLWEWARWSDTIGYEVACGFSDRVTRVTLGANRSVERGRR